MWSGFNLKYTHQNLILEYQILTFEVDVCANLNNFGGGAKLIGSGVCPGGGKSVSYDFWGLFGKSVKNLDSFSYLIQTILNSGKFFCAHIIINWARIGLTQTT